MRIVERGLLQANDYNPNIVLRDNLELLTRSILVNGFTQPIVCTADYIIIDGYHRYIVSGQEPLLSKLGGMVPVVVVRHDDAAKNIYGTITHNRARGVHQLGPMKAVIKRLIEAGKSVEEIGKELGMRSEEVFRLSDFSREDFLLLMSRGVTGFSPAKIIMNV